MQNDLKVGFTIASSSIKRGNKKTTILTIFVLSLIFVNLIFLPSMINGMMDVFVGAVKDYTYGDIVIEPRDQQPFINNADSILQTINAVPGVKAASKRLSSGGTIFYKEKFVGANILGVNPDEEIRVSKFAEIVKEGDFLSRMSRDEIMLGALLAGSEGGPEIYDDLGGVKVGNLVNVTFSNGVTRQYKVKGIHSAGPEISDLIALVHYKELEDVLGMEGQDKASTIVIRVYNEGEETEIKQKIIGLGIKEKIETWEDKVLDMIRDMLKSFGLLSIMSDIVGIIIAVFIIFIIIYINTLNRKKQIGILRAIGITPQSIILSYMMISLFYVILGILAGFLLLLLIVLYLKANPILFYETIVLSPAIDFTKVFESSLSLIIMALVAGFIPAWMVAREPIIKAIWGR